MEIIAKNRDTGQIRKIRETHAEKSMRKIEELLRKIKPDEAVIEVFVDAIPLL